MTDIHSHIIYGIDDGSNSIDESIELIKRLKEVGFDNIIITPHFIDGTEYCSYNDEKLEKLEELKRVVKENNIKVNLFLGNEIFINNHMIEDIVDNKTYTLNNTKYILFEIPFNNQILNLSDIIYEIKIKGYIPVLAHPERYLYFQDDYSFVNELHEDGVLFQANFASILGFYGKDAEKLLKYMLKNKYVDFLGTDIHYFNRTYVTDNFFRIEKAIIKYAGEDYYKKIINNANLLVEKVN